MLVRALTDCSDHRQGSIPSVNLSIAILPCPPPYKVRIPGHPPIVLIPISILCGLSRLSFPHIFSIHPSFPTEPHDRPTQYISIVSIDYSTDPRSEDRPQCQFHQHHQHHQLPCPPDLFDSAPPLSRLLPFSSSRSAIAIWMTIQSRSAIFTPTVPVIISKHLADIYYRERTQTLIPTWIILMVGCLTYTACSKKKWTCSIYIQHGPGNIYISWIHNYYNIISYLLGYSALPRF